MKRRHKREYVFRRCWRLFDREAYHWAWKDKKVRGVFSRFARDIKFCRQRITRGYCDEDLFSIYDWFLDVVPAMLMQYREHHHGSPGILGKNYTNEEGILVNDTCHEEWDAILDRMIFLFRESSEDSCQRKNPYEEEHMRIFEEFEKKYGMFGEGLQTEEEKAESARTGNITMHFPDELPEYAGVEAAYTEEEKKLGEYRNRCKDEAFELFSQWFFYLWD